MYSQTKQIQHQQRSCAAQIVEYAAQIVLHISATGCFEPGCHASAAQGIGRHPRVLSRDCCFCHLSKSRVSSRDCCFSRLSKSCGREKGSKIKEAREHLTRQPEGGLL